VPDAGNPIVESTSITVDPADTLDTTIVLGCNEKLP